MIDKMKGLGNSILGEQLFFLKRKPEFTDTFSGNFGLSTDNFKFEPNGQGGYSLNFLR